MSTPTAPPGFGLARGVYGVLLGLLPASYRRLHVRELQAFFEEAYRDAYLRHGWRGALGCVVRAAVDVMRAAADARWGPDRARPARPRLADIGQDVRYAIRSIRKAPVVAAVSVITAALGVGANTAIFSIVNAVMLTPLPYPEPDRLVTLWEANPARDMQRMSVSYPNFASWRENQRWFTDIGAIVSSSLLLRGENGGEARQVAVTLTTPDVFDVLRVRPALGRGFRVEDATPGAPLVVVMSHRIWRTQFGGDPDIVGRTVRFVGGSAEVVGVMPESFDFPSAETELWAPIVPDRGSWTVRAAHGLTVVARLAPGVTLHIADEGVRAMAAAVQELHPGEDPAHSATALPLDTVVVEDVRTGLMLLFGAVGMVLLIALVNVAGLILARSATRAREIALRRALGASRGRVVRQLVTEGVLLATLAGIAGLLTARWAVDLVLPLVPEAIPRASAIAIDVPVLVFALGVSIVAGVAFSLAPAFHATRGDLVSPLRTGRQGLAGPRSLRIRRGLVVTEVALSTVLLIGAGLLINSFWHLQRVDPGFDPESMVTMTVTLNGTGVTTRDEIVSFYRTLPERLTALPGIRTVSAVNTLPVNPGDSYGTVTVEGLTFPAGAAPSAGFRRVLPGYFESMGIPLLSGRDFTARDDGTGDFVTIVDQSMAERFWPDGDALGKRIKVGPPENEPWLTVVGVVGDVHNEFLDAAPKFATYEPHPQRPWSTMNIIMRTDLDPTAAGDLVRHELTNLDPDIAVYGTNSMQGRIHRSFASRRFHMVLLGTFAAVALVLTVAGIYGVLSYTVIQRRQEIGIRIALGASSGRVRQRVVGDALLLAGIGVALGTGLALVSVRALRSFVFEVSVLDPLTLGAVALLLLAVAAAASVVPATRATTVKPVEVLTEM